MPFYDTSGERDADRYLRMKENMEDDFQSPHLFPEAHADTNALAELVIALPPDSKNPSNNEPTLMTCIVSATEEALLYSGNKMQIGIKAPIGQFIYKNLHNLKVGMQLPNGAEIREIIHPK